MKVIRGEYPLDDIGLVLTAEEFRIIAACVASSSYEAVLKVVPEALLPNTVGIVNDIHLVFGPIAKEIDNEIPAPTSDDKTW